MYRRRKRTVAAIAGAFAGVACLGVLSIANHWRDVANTRATELAAEQAVLAETRDSLAQWRQTALYWQGFASDQRMQIEKLEAALRKYDLAMENGTLVEATPLQELVATDFTVMGYCPCSACCSSYADNRPSYSGREVVITAGGAFAQEGVTCAVDPDVIPLGSVVLIEGVGIRIAQDTGVTGHAVDVYFENHVDTHTVTATDRSLWILQYRR